MNEPLRLREQGADDFECDLILSARRDQPGPKAFRRTLTSLGVGLSLPLGAAGVAQGAVVGAVVAPAKIGGVVLTKWLATGALFGVVTVGGARVAEHALTPKVPAVTVATDGKARAPVSERSAPEAAPTGWSSPPASIEPAEPPAAVRADPGAEHAPTSLSSAVVASGGAVPPSRAFEPLAPPDQDALKREITAVDAAREALRGGDARGAIGRLEQYEKAFPGGALSPEASVLRVRALLAVGERARAEELARRVIDADPSGPHADVVRSLLVSGHNR